jgi:PAS domain S-box-containing protein
MDTKGTILVVEDSPVNLKLLVSTLTAGGYQVFSANSGESALDSVGASPPELILLDIQMPGLNGFEVLRRLRMRTESRDIPVVLVSASEETEDQVEGFQLGAVDFISKPFKRQELLARVQTHLELRRLHLRLEQQADDLRQINDRLQGELAERRQAEVALHRSETKFRTLYDSTTDAVMLLDQNGFFDCNQATLAIFGCATREEFASKHPADVSPPTQPDGADSRTVADERLATALEKGSCQFEWVHRRVDTGETFPADVLLSAMKLDGKPVLQSTVRNISARKRTEAERNQLIEDLQSALANVKSLSGLLPICAGCKKIRDDKGYWNQVETYIQIHSDARFSHGLCPDCIKKWYPELERCGLADPTEKPPGVQHP